MASGDENWVRVGRAFVSEKGTIQLRLDALPIDAFWPDKKLTMFPKDGQHGTYYDVSYKKVEP